MIDYLDTAEEMLLLLLLSRFSRVRLFTTPWTAAYQASPSMGSSRQEKEIPYSKFSMSLVNAGKVNPEVYIKRILCPWDSPGKNTGVGSHALLQGIFLAQGSNLGLPNCRQILYHLSHQGSPHIKQETIEML